MLMNEAEYEEMSESGFGYCSFCDAVTVDGGVEPDAEKYECTDCGNNQVMGLYNAMLSNLILISEEQ